MAAGCPICDDRKFRSMFDELILAGGDLPAAKKLVENELILPEGKKCSTYRIKLHALTHTGIDPDKIHPSFFPNKRSDPEEVAQRKKEREVTQAVVEAHLDEIASIDIEKILSSLGISSRPKNMEDVLGLAQQMGVGLHMLAGAIAVDRLQKFAADPEGRRYPSVELKGAHLASEMMSAAFGYSQAISLQSAVDTVERAGYEVLERGTGDKHKIEGG